MDNLQSQSLMQITKNQREVEFYLMKIACSQKLGCKGTPIALQHPRINGTKRRGAGRRTLRRKTKGIAPIAGGGTSVPSENSKIKEANAARPSTRRRSRLSERFPPARADCRPFRRDARARGAGPHARQPSGDALGVGALTASARGRGASSAGRGRRLRPTWQHVAAGRRRCCARLSRRPRAAFPPLPVASRGAEGRKYLGCNISNACVDTIRGHLALGEKSVP